MTVVFLHFQQWVLNFFPHAVLVYPLIIGKSMVFKYAKLFFYKRFIIEYPLWRQRDISRAYLVLVVFGGHVLWEQPLSAETVWWWWWIIRRNIYVSPHSAGSAWKGNNLSAIFHDGCGRYENITLSSCHTHTTPDNPVQAESISPGRGNPSWEIVFPSFVTL